MRRLWLAAAFLLLIGCRDVRVHFLREGTTQVLGGNEIAIVRDSNALDRLGIHAPVRFRSEFGVILLMGPHDRSGFRQVVESIGGKADRIRVVAFEQPPADGGEPSPRYRTFTLWIVPNSAYRKGVRVEVVTPSDDPVASTNLP